MPLPQLIEEDLRVLDDTLATLLGRCEASMAMLIDQAGFLITQAGEVEQFDTTTLAALAAGSYAATQGMASITQETTFNSVYQQGEKHSLLIVNVDENCLVVVVFKASVGVGMVKYHSLAAVTTARDQLQKARDRAPSVSLDLAAMNLDDSCSFFRRKVDVSEAGA